MIHSNNPLSHRNHSISLLQFGVTHSLSRQPFGSNQRILSPPLQGSIRFLNCLLPPKLLVGIASEPTFMNYS